MHVFVEGPKWAGMWTEIVVDVLHQLGCTSKVFYHNSKSGFVLMQAALNRLVPSTRRFLQWENAQQERMFQSVCQSGCEMLFSIQGKIDSRLVTRLKECNPDLKIVYWLGDVMVEPTRRRLDSLRTACQEGQVDALLVSYRGTYDFACAKGYKNVEFFPFGMSPTYHVPKAISAADRAAYTSKVSFVGSGYPERADIIRFLNTHLDEPVRVWGRGWGKLGIASEGALDLADSIKVYASSQISLNIHHNLTDNGFNMKFYEIPAAGGFEIGDYQDQLVHDPLGKAVPSFKNPVELLDLINFYLENDAERKDVARQQHELASSQCLYLEQFKRLFKRLEFVTPDA